MVSEFLQPAAGPMVKSGAAIPVPDRRGRPALPATLSKATIRFAVDAPAAVGANCTLMVRFAEESTFVQLLVWLNSPASAPPRSRRDRQRYRPVLVKVTGIELLLVPTVCEGKVTDAGKLAPTTETVVLISTKIVFPGTTIRSCLPSPFMSAASSGNSVKSSKTASKEPNSAVAVSETSKPHTELIFADPLIANFVRHSVTIDVRQSGDDIARCCYLLESTMSIA